MITWSSFAAIVNGHVCPLSFAVIEEIKNHVYGDWQTSNWTTRPSYHLIFRLLIWEIANVNLAFAVFRERDSKSL